jgi:Asp-tRNA(Asn)/Glu-tRNA(Gln) amidotransferase A subunit family amidase
VIPPTSPGPPPHVGAFSGRPVSEALLAASRVGAYTALFNVTGQPAGPVPVPDAGPLPLGVQAASHAGCDALVIAEARVVEEELGAPFAVAPACLCAPEYRVAPLDKTPRRAASLAPRQEPCE